MMLENDAIRLTTNLRFQMKMKNTEREKYI